MKGDQLRDPSKAKTWLFTTLYREFLSSKRKQERLVPGNEDIELRSTPSSASVSNQLDGKTAYEALLSLEENYRAPLTLFYPEAAALERSTFTPVLSETSFPNGAFRVDGARASLFVFVNGQTGHQSPPAQGLNHLVIDGLITKDATPFSFDVFQALFDDGDARNVLEVFPTMLDPVLRNEYSPAWDLHLSKWRNALVASGQNIAQTDAFTIRTRAEQFDITSPGGFKLAAAGIEVNCPVVAFVNDPPLAPLVPAPIPLPLPFQE